MNQLANAIHRLSDGQGDVDQLDLNLADQSALHAVKDLLRLPCQDLAKALMQADLPTEWAVPLPRPVE